MSQIIPLFKPFTIDEVCQMTGVPPKVLDVFMESKLPIQSGDEGTQGLNYMQAFAAMVGYKYLKEGSDHARALAVVGFVGAMDQKYMEQEFLFGRSFPVPPEMIPDRRAVGMLVAPPKSPLGHRLNLKVIYGEFQEGLKRVFPNG